MHYLCAWRWTSQLTLRITIQENTEAVTVKVEGRIAGPWAAELGTVWEKLAPSLDGRTVCLDLRDATYIDAEGMLVLRQIYHQTKADFHTRSPLTRYFAEQACRSALEDIPEDH